MVAIVSPDKTSARSGTVNGPPVEAGRDAHLPSAGQEDTGVERFSFHDSLFRLVEEDEAFDAATGIVLLLSDHVRHKFRLCFVHGEIAEKKVCVAFSDAIRRDDGTAAWAILAEAKKKQNETMAKISEAREKMIEAFVGFEDIMEDALRILSSA